jgi:hypothetical protein
MTMCSQAPALVEDDESHVTAEEWSTMFISPAPSAPTESDLMVYSASEQNVLAVDHPEAHSVEGELNLPPALLPVAVMESTQPPGNPLVLYDYQRDRVVYSPTSIIVAEVSSEREFEYSYRDISSSSQQPDDMFQDGVFQDDVFQDDARIEQSSTAVASGVAGVVVGTLLFGTLPGLVAGFYASYAHGQTGAAGDVSRALGEIALVVREKAIVIDRKHNLVVRGKIALAEAWEHAKLLDRQHRIIKRMKEFAKFSLTMTFHWIRRNNLLESRTGPTTARQCNRNRQPVPVSNSLEHTRSQQETQIECRRRRSGGCYQQAGVVPLNFNSTQARSY